MAQLGEEEEEFPLRWGDVVGGEAGGFVGAENLLEDGVGRDEGVC